tara:strand:+ start:3401 stop:3865 length:465 start_codon:yes stop_codon:yes gene_type:complete
MATELSAQTLTVTVTEALAVDHANGESNDIDFAQTYTHTYANVKNVTKRIINLANTNLTTILNFSTSESAGTVVRTNVKYIRVTNLDNSQTLQVGLDDGSDDAAFVSVAADSSIIFTATTCEGDSGGTTLDNATKLSVKGGHNNHNLELFVASA